MRRGLVITALAACFFPAQAGAVDVVVTLDGPPLARAIAQSRALSAAVKQARLNLSSPTSEAHLEGLARAQNVLAARIERALPQADVSWRYRIVLNGLAVSLPGAQVERLRALPGVAAVLRSTTYRATAGGSAAGAAVATALATGGEGVKIAILDDGVDHRHPFFDPAGFTMPAGFPKGNTAFTTAKVIAARAFAPSTPRWRNAALPFDGELSVHGTHVAGIAAGNAGVRALGQNTTVSGIAPRAYIGNYKVLTIPTEAGLGLNGNSPEIAAGVEAAVADGMDVINLSLGEPEVEPSRDLVTRAIDGAVTAGVVVTVAAGNDGDSHGPGSVGSPGSAARAITAAASSGGNIAAFSSIGPTPLSLRLKPDLAAPGVDVLSSVPAREGLWANFSGTSMAAPHVAGLVAILLEGHPTWTPLQVKSALVQTAVPMSAQPPRAGAGQASSSRADDPLLFANPTAVSFGLMRRGTTAGATIELTDAGGGAGAWSVAVDQASEGVLVTAPPTVTVPGTLELTATATSQATATTHTGFVTLTRGSAVRRVAYWLRVGARNLAGHQVTPLVSRGVHVGNTSGRPALVDRYRYPEVDAFPGPEQVYRVTIAKPVANFGVVLLGAARGVEVEARIVHAGDEDRMVGYTSLPFNLNPYQESFGAFRAAAGVLLPAAGDYDVVFDTPSGGRPGRFSFRFWISDTAPPTVKPVALSVKRNRAFRLRVVDNGSGVDPASIDARINGRLRTATINRGIISVDTRGLLAKTHRLVLRVSDYQETRNNENVSRILPNTRTLTLKFRITR